MFTKAPPSYYWYMFVSDCSADLLHEKGKKHQAFYKNEF